MIFRDFLRKSAKKTPENKSRAAGSPPRREISRDVFVHYTQKKQNQAVAQKNAMRIKSRMANEKMYTKTNPIGKGF